jgi:hypothetical protein
MRERMTKVGRKERWEGRKGKERESKEDRK